MELSVIITKIICKVYLRPQEVSHRSGSCRKLQNNPSVSLLADYIFRKEDVVRKGIGEIMGGKVLELESERLKAEGEAIGQARGEAIGQIQGENRLGSLISRLLQDQRIEEIQIVSTDPKRREQLYKEYNL